MRGVAVEDQNFIFSLEIAEIHKEVLLKVKNFIFSLEMAEIHKEVLFLAKLKFLWQKLILICLGLILGRGGE